jgi:hypothetical protein
MQLGAIKGSLDYLGIKSDIPTLAGGLGYAFIINITNGNCPSGPYFTVSCATDVLSKLGENLGYHAQTVMSRYDKSDAAQRREEARELTLRSVGKGLPVYFWAKPGPGYQVIQEAGEEGIRYGNDGSKSRKWSEFGGVDFTCISPGAKPPDWRKAARDGIAFALEHGTSPAKWRMARGDYENFGLKAYDALADRVRNQGKKLKWDDVQTAGHYGQCRMLGVEYLGKLAGLTDGGVSSVIADCKAKYTTVAEHLQSVAKVFDPKPEPPIDEIVETALARIASARAAEGVALEALREVGQRI